MTVTLNVPFPGGIVIPLTFDGASHASHGRLIADEALVGTYSVDSDCRFAMNFSLNGQAYTWSGMLFDNSQQAYLLESAPQGEVIIGAMRQQNECEGKDRSDH
jgi:hypothetical protein